MSDTDLCWIEVLKIGDFIHARYRRRHTSRAVKSTTVCSLICSWQRETLWTLPYQRCLLLFKNLDLFVEQPTSCFKA